MDKKQFAEQVINEVRNLSVTSVLSTRMNLLNRYGHSKGLCPFHNDGKIGSFVATDSKGIWKCFSCGVGGDTVKFVSLYDNINYLESAFKLGLEFGIISHSDYEEYFEKRRYSREVIVKIERKYAELDKKKMENDIADNYTLDKVFRMFISESSLSEEHKNYLMNERQLTEEEIAEGMYFTFPTRSILPKFAEKIRKNNDGDESILAKIPGFYFDKKENRFTFAYHRGIGIGIKNAKGQVVGIQIRRDKTEEGKSRYIWFSSSFASFEDKFDYGTSSGSPIDVVYPKVITNSNVFITEGRFKAQQIAKEIGSIAISVQGVGTWRGIVKELEVIPESLIVKTLLPDKEFEINALLVAFDSDMNYKVQVFEQARKMTDALEKVDVENMKYPVYYMNWDESFGKGIDDVIINGNKNVIKKYDKKKWDKQYEKMIEDILEKEDYLEIKNVPAEIVQKYFHQHFNNFPNIPRGQLSEKHKEKLQKKEAIKKLLINQY